MINNKKILAIIPARAGSKRLPGKNVKKLVGKPLIQWTIEAVQACQFVDTIVISTDDPKVIDISEKLGVKIPFIRPESLAQDSSSSIDVIFHAISHFEQLGDKYDFILLLQPTSPLRTSRHILEAISLMNDKNADGIISVCEAEHSPLWMNTLDDTFDMSSFLKDEVKNKRSQDLKQYYRLNGAIYLININRLKNEKTMLLKDNIYAYEMDRMSSVDIDEQIDFYVAEAVLRNLY